MNILTITAQKPDSTGSGVYLAETVRGFARLGHDVAVVCGVDVADEPCVPGASRVFPVRFNTPELPFSVVGMSDVMPYEATRYRDLTPDQVALFKRAFATAVGEAVAARKPDLVVCHHLYLLTALVAQMGLPCPVYAICHSTDLRQMGWHDLEREFIVAGIRRLGGVLALHGAQPDVIVATYGVPADRIHIVGTGYNDAEFFARPGLREPGVVQAVYVGKIGAAKGVHSLLRCLDRLPFDADGFRLRLVGGHSQPAEYDMACELARDSRYDARLLGRVSQDDLVRLYNESDVFVLPSFYEGLPLVVIEALACGCRVVVTDLPGIRPWIEEQMPGAPVVYVRPPRMEDVDKPLAEDLPAFEIRLADALVEAAALPAPTEREVRGYTGHLSWTELAARILRAAGVQA